MTTEERNVLNLFRRYLVRPTEMLFVYAQDCRVSIERFVPVMRGLVEKGLVVKERPQSAYSLTPAGYRFSQTAQPRPATTRGRPRTRLNRKAKHSAHVVAAR